MRDEKEPVRNVRDVKGNNSSVEEAVSDVE